MVSLLRQLLPAFPVKILVVFLGLVGLGYTVMLSSAAPEQSIAEAHTYLPLIYYKYPVRTIFGAEMAAISTGQGAAQMRAAGSSWVRRNGIFWSEVEPVQGGGYHWSGLASLESEILQAHAHEMEVILVVRSLPVWARVGPLYHACGNLAFHAVDDFANFMQAVVQRYSEPPYNVRYWEIWNEPDVDAGLLEDGDLPYGCLGNQYDIPYYGGGAYANILKAVYPRIKAVDPHAQVLIGGLLLDCNPDEPPIYNPDKDCMAGNFLRGILENDGQDYFDGISFHAYDYFTIGATANQQGIYGSPNWNSGGSFSYLYGDLKPVLVKKTAFLRGILNAYSVTGKSLLNTEVGLLCGGGFDPPGGPGCEADPNSMFETLKAAYVPQAYAAALAEGLSANLWYTPRGWRNSGLLYNDLSPRPAYHAYTLAYNTLHQARYVRTITEYDANNVFGYEFAVLDQRIWVLWTLDGTPRTLQLPGLPQAAWNQTGIPIPVNTGSLTIGQLQTIYLSWTP